jgi:preprotein translocase subunit SecG
MLMLAGVVIFLAIVLALMYLDRRRQTKTKHAH